MLADAGYAPLADAPSTTIAANEGKSTKSKASLFSICANLVMSGLGAGILSLPWAMAGASIVPSVITILVVMLLNVGTIMILVCAAERHQAFDLGALLAHLPGGLGPVVEVFNNSLTWVSVFLTLVGYIVVMADSMEPFMGVLLGWDTKTSGDNFWSIRAPLLAASGMVVLPICFVDQQRLAVSSVVGICVTIYLFIVVATLFWRDGVATDCCVVSSAVHEGSLTMFSILMQCSIVQMCVLPMYEEMENRSPRRFGIAVGTAFAFLALLFAAFSAVAYVVFGPQVQGNVMMNLPHDALGSFARVGMTLVMLAVFPIMMMSMVAPIRHWEETTGRTNGHITAVVSFCIVAASAIGAAFVGQLGELNAMNGAMQVNFFIGIAPGLTGLYLMGTKGAVWRVAMYALVFASVVASVLGGYYTDNAVDQLSASCLWRT